MRFGQVMLRLSDEEAQTIEKEQRLLGVLTDADRDELRLAVARIEQIREERDHARRSVEVEAAPARMAHEANQFVVAVRSARCDGHFDHADAPATVQARSDGLTERHAVARRGRTQRVRFDDVPARGAEDVDHADHVKADLANEPVRVPHVLHERQTHLVGAIDLAEGHARKSGRSTYDGVARVVASVRDHVERVTSAVNAAYVHIEVHREHSDARRVPCSFADDGRRAVDVVGVKLLALGVGSEELHASAREPVPDLAHGEVRDRMTASQREHDLALCGKHLVHGVTDAVHRQRVLEPELSRHAAKPDLVIEHDHTLRRQVRLDPERPPELSLTFIEPEPADRTVAPRVVREHAVCDVVLWFRMPMQTPRANGPVRQIVDEPSRDIGAQHQVSRRGDEPPLLVEPPDLRSLGCIEDVHEKIMRLRNNFALHGLSPVPKSFIGVNGLDIYG